MSHRSFSLMRSGLVLAAIAPFVFLAGCSNMASTATGTGALTQVSGLSGIVHGGRQPVSGATVTLWAAGNTGYGSAAAQLATTTTDTTGSFSFHPAGGASYSCPSISSSTASQSIYITTSGGQPSTGVTNSEAAFMVALGDCSTVLAANPSLDINEVTTVASMVALQQFFKPNTTSGLGSFGTSATNANGLKNAMATVNNLVNISNGTANTTLVVSGAVIGYSTNPSITITPEQSKINTMANALASCVNSDGGSTSTCATLFPMLNATAPLDTLQAAYYMAVNPTSTVSGTANIGTIYSNIPSASPFSPTLGAVPTDWTIGVTYGSTSSQTVGTTAVYFLTQPEYVAIDSTGNLWIANYKSGTSSTVPGSSLTELSPLGVPVNQVLTAAGQVVIPRPIVIDPSNNVWVESYGISTAYGTQVLEYTSAGATKTFTTAAGPVNLTSDGAGNIYVATTTGSGTHPGGSDLAGRYSQANRDRPQQ